jgi:hypothetical protein
MYVLCTYVVQSDQIGRIFAYWAVVCILEKSKFFFKLGIEVAQKWATLFHGNCSELFLTKNGLGKIFGVFFTNLSGHPDPNPMYVDDLGLKMGCDCSQHVFL